MRASKWSEQHGSLQIQNRGAAWIITPPLQPPFPWLQASPGTQASLGSKATFLMPSPLASSSAPDARRHHSGPDQQRWHRQDSHLHPNLISPPSPAPACLDLPLPLWLLLCLSRGTRGTAFSTLLFTPGSACHLLRSASLQIRVSLIFC